MRAPFPVRFALVLLVGLPSFAWEGKWTNTGKNEVRIQFLPLIEDPATAGSICVKDDKGKVLNKFKIQNGMKGVSVSGGSFITVSNDGKCAGEADLIIDSAVGKKDAPDGRLYLESGEVVFYASEDQHIKVINAKKAMFTINFD